MAAAQSHSGTLARLALGDLGGEEHGELQQDILKYLPAIFEILDSLPRPVLLLLKLNDCLRSAGRQLGAPATDAYISAAKACIAALRESGNPETDSRFSFDPHSGADVHRVSPSGGETKDIKVIGPVDCPPSADLNFRTSLWWATWRIWGFEWLICLQSLDGGSCLTRSFLFPPSSYLLCFMHFLTWEFLVACIPNLFSVRLADMDH